MVHYNSYYNYHIDHSYHNYHTGHSYRIDHTDHCPVDYWYIFGSYLSVVAVDFDKADRCIPVGYWNTPERYYSLVHYSSAVDEAVDLDTAVPCYLAGNNTPVNSLFVDILYFDSLSDFRN